MVVATALVFVGLAFIVFGADRFIEGTAETASLLRVSPFFIGMAVVGFATSAPEILVSAVAATGGNPVMGITNAIGSNIANIGLVLGITAIISPVSVRPSTEQSRFLGIPDNQFAMLAAMSLAAAVLANEKLTRPDGILLVIVLSFFCFCAHRYGMKDRHPYSSNRPVEHQTKVKRRVTKRVLVQLVFGFAALLLGSKLLVEGATVIARNLGLSDAVIGLTILAVGTSLPELAASLASAVKNKPEILLGNIIGSNIFNSLAVLAVPALLYPVSFSSQLAPGAGLFSQPEPEIMQRDVPCMLALGLALVLMARLPRSSGCISRIEGLLLFGAFASYQYFLF